MTSFSLFAFCTTLKKLNTPMANLLLMVIKVHKENKDSRNKVQFTSSPTHQRRHCRENLEPTETVHDDNS